MARARPTQLTRGTRIRVASHLGQLPNALTTKQQHKMADSTARTPSKAPQALSNREEDALMKQVRAEAVKKCDPVVRQFAECAQGRTISVAWACRSENKAFKECISTHMSNEGIERARREYLLAHRS